MELNTNKYITRLSVRPDDIDMFMHVHSSRYIDYVLAARFDQMERCYGCGMNVFMEHNLGWVLVSTELNFKRPLKLGDSFDVETQLTSFNRNIAEINFDITHAKTGKSCCSGWANYTLVNINTGKIENIPEWVIEKYSLTQ